MTQAVNWLAVCCAAFAVSYFVGTVVLRRLWSKNLRKR